MTFGEKAVAIDFNPMGLPEITEAKTIIATAIDQMECLRSSAESSQNQKHHASVAITDLETALFRMEKAIMCV